MIAWWPSAGKELAKRTFRSRYSHTPVREHSERPMDTVPSRERAVPLAFRLFCFTLCRLKCLYWCLGHDVEFDFIDFWSLSCRLFWEDYIHNVPQYHILPSYLAILRILTCMHYINIFVKNAHKSVPIVHVKFGTLAWKVKAVYLIYLFKPFMNSFDLIYMFAFLNGWRVRSFSRGPNDLCVFV